MKSELAIKRINSIENEIHNIWSDLNFYNLSQLEEAWNDPVCKEFIEIILIMLLIILFLTWKF